MKLPAKKIALILSYLTMVVFIINLLTLPSLPFLLSLRYNFLTGSQSIISFIPLDPSAMKEYLVSLCFYFLCGVITAVLLWQSRSLLFNLAGHRTFVVENSRILSRASACLFILSALALIRTAIWLTYMPLAQVLLAYNTLFVPVFFIAGLLLQILSALFYEASEIKNENDLTI